MSALTVVVATIGKAHGLRGETALILRTDQPEERLAPGTVYRVDAPTGPRTLTVAATRVSNGRWYARFEEVADRTAAEELRGVDLALEVDTEEEADADPDAWYPSELKGLAVRRIDDGEELGTVVDLLHYPAQDLLVVRTGQGRRVMLPFVEELVPEVDLDQQVVLADPPGGLFEDLPEDAPNEGRAADDDASSEA